MQLVNRLTGERVEPVLVDAASGRPVTDPDFHIVPGPAATDGLRRWLDRSAEA